MSQSDGVAREGIPWAPWVVFFFNFVDQISGENCHKCPKYCVFEINNAPAPYVVVWTVKAKRIPDPPQILTDESFHVLDSTQRQTCYFIEFIANLPLFSLHRYTSMRWGRYHLLEEARRLGIGQTTWSKRNPKICVDCRPCMRCDRGDQLISANEIAGHLYFLPVESRSWLTSAPAAEDSWGERKLGASSEATVTYPLVVINSKGFRSGNLANHGY